MHSEVNLELSYSRYEISRYCQIFQNMNLEMNFIVEEIKP